MIHNISRFITALALLATAQGAWAQSSFSGGSGTQADPYKISSSADLVQLATDINNSTSRLYEDQYFVQTGNINMSGINFVPIGINDNNYHRFRGKYNGQNYTISNLTVNGSYDYAGLFGYIYNGDIDNVRLVSPSITNTKNSYTSALVGFGNMPGIHNCLVINPTLSGGNSIGVFAGGQYAGNIQYTYYTGNNNYSNVGYTNGSNANTSIGRAYTLTLASGVTTSTAPAFSYGGTDYYAGTITLGAAPTGWTYAYSVNGSAISGNTFDISADASVTVTRTPIDYTITYNLGGGTNASGNPSTYTIQSETITLAAPTREGYTFGGWYANSSLTGDAVTTIASGSTGDVTLWAKWTPTQYTIAYNLDDGTNAEGNPTAYTIESEAITLGAATKTGYTFGGWYRSADLSGDAVTTIGGGQTGDVELWAKWTANRYAISFVGNGKTGGTMYNELFNYDEAKALTACAYTRTGYHFTGWNTEADGSGTAYADGQTVQNLTAEPDATLTLYAQWTANTYSVHFDPVIPVNGTMTDMTLTYDQEATALTKNAFSTTTGQWLRWNTERDGSGTDYEDEAEVQNLTAEQDGTVTLYAQWRLQHRFNYDSGIFRCYNAANTNEVYWAYEGETVKVEVIDPTSEYTIRVTAEDGTAIAFDTETNTFTMPDQEVYVTSTSVKKMAYTTILLDDFDAWTDVVYLYDASQPTVTPTVTVMDGETVLTEGTDYTLEITNNTGSATQMVTATVTVTGKGGYVGTATETFRITPFNIANCEIRGTLEAYDDGYGVYYPLSEKVEVWNGETQLTLDTDYSLEVEYAESYEVGEFYNATVTGAGDWGGTKTFQFQVVELTHTVVFVANGGSGTMASDVATKGQHYYLPECGFTAPAGKVFDHWVASCEEGEEKQPGDYFTAPYIWSENDVVTITVTAYWRECETVSVTLAPAGYGTYYDSANDIILPAGMKARIVTNNDGNGSLTYQTIADGDNLAGNVVPAGTAVLLQTAPTADPQQHVLMLSGKSADRYEGTNLLHGSDTETTTTGDNDATTGYYFYKLTYGSETGHEDLFGWYWGTEGGAAFTSPAHKVWLALPADIEHGEDENDPARRFIGLPDFGEANGIQSLSKESRSEGVWYTLDGKRLNGVPTAKGLYINNGKKVVIK